MSDIESSPNNTMSDIESPPNLKEVPVPNEAEEIVLTQASAPKLVIGNNILTVAVLLVATTYQAAINPPGGIWTENDPPGPPYRPPGTSILASKNLFKFLGFVFMNTTVFFFSLGILDELTGAFPQKIEIRAALYNVALSYVWILVSIIPANLLVVPISACIITVGEVYFMQFLKRKGVFPRVPRI